MTKVGSNSKRTSLRKGSQEGRFAAKKCDSAHSIKTQDFASDVVFE